MLDIAKDAFGNDWISAALTVCDSGGSLAVGNRRVSWTQDWRTGIKIRHRIAKKSCNFPSGAPSELQLYPSGTVRSKRYFQDGIANDLPDGTPHHTDYYSSGIENSRTYRTHGVLQNTIRGGAAHQKFYPCGALNRADYHTAGQNVDCADGTPSIIEYFADGTISAAWTSTGVGSRMLKQAQAIERLAQVRHTQAISLCAEPQGIMAKSRYAPSLVKGSLFK